MNRYTVRSTFKDAKGRDLFHRKTFDGMAEDARFALLEAHAEMARLGAEDPRVDSISSTVKGPNEEISTTDYLDELGRGMSGAGLMNEVKPEDLEQARELNVSLGLPPGDGLDGIMIGNPTEKDNDLYGANRATGGVVPSHGTFRGTNERDPASPPKGSDKGNDKPKPLSGADARGPSMARGWKDPSSDPLAGRRRIEDESYGVPEWLTPPVRDFRSPNADTTRKTVGDIIKESKERGEPTLKEMSDMVKADRFGQPRGLGLDSKTDTTKIQSMWDALGFTPNEAQREMLSEMYAKGSKKYEQQTLGRWADNE